MKKNKEKPAGNFEEIEGRSSPFFRKKDLPQSLPFDKQSFIIPSEFISDHMRKHRYPKGPELGWYLAGSIEGLERPIFSIEDKIEIPFKIEDIRTAYYIKKEIGYGRVIKTKHSAVYLLQHSIGLKNIIELIKESTVFQTDLYKPFGFPVASGTSLNLLNNYWLAGFADRNGKFNIELKSESDIQMCRLEFLIRHKTEGRADASLEILRRIKQNLGGELTTPSCEGQLSHSETTVYLYNSTNMKTAYKIIKYFDNYNLINPKKYRQYFQWRKAYRMIQRKEHLTSKGLIKLEKLQKSLRD